LLRNYVENWHDSTYLQDASLEQSRPTRQQPTLHHRESNTITRELQGSLR
jgi:hypothetical protein